MHYRRDADVTHPRHPLGPAPGTRRLMWEDFQPGRPTSASSITPSPALFFNRELSWLSFTERVLHEAEDDRTPLLERLKFLAIFAGNLDEFFMVRVAGLRRQVAAGV